MKRKIFIILLVFIIISVYKTTNQNIIIPDTSIRLRVIPNSNSPEDINIKEKVKEYLEDNIYNITKNTSEINKARIIINESIPTIESNINNIFKNNNYNLPYKVNYGYNYFPQKEYKEKIYKEGYYESLVISIGNANGDNWWCVLFPNYCLIDKQEKYEYKSYIKEIITKLKHNIK